MDQRPNLDKNISVKDFQDFYWLKEELVAFCRTEGLKKTGSKIEITQRIVTYLQTGEKPIETKTKTQTKKKSNFDWHNTELSLETIITDNYKNTEQVRQFFSTQIGSQFKFNVIFMQWMKVNVGKTLEDAIQAWKKIDADKKSNKKPKHIAPQFEYNRYLRDFLADNPDKSREMGIQLWKIKRSMRGDNVYRKTDLSLLNTNK